MRTPTRPLAGEGVPRTISEEWFVARILAKEVQAQQTRFKVRWKSTWLNRHEVKLRGDGTSYAVFDGHEYDIDDIVRHDGSVVEVFWADSWHGKLDLNADDLIKDFEAGLHPPDDREDLGRGEITFASFAPELDVDYTASFVLQLQAELSGFWDRYRHGGKYPIWAAYLEKPTRNLITFRKPFVDKRNVVNLNPNNARHEHRRILSIHRVGNARLQQCNNCREGEGEWLASWCFLSDQLN